MRRPTPDGAGGSSLFAHGGCLGRVTPRGASLLVAFCSQTAARGALELMAWCVHCRRGHTRASGIRDVSNAAAHMDPRSGTTDDPRFSHRYAAPLQPVGSHHRSHWSYLGPRERVDGIFSGGLWDQGAPDAGDVFDHDSAACVRLAADPLWRGGCRSDHIQLSAPAGRVDSDRCFFDSRAPAHRLLAAHWCECLAVGVQTAHRAADLVGGVAPRHIRDTIVTTLTTRGGVLWILTPFCCCEWPLAPIKSTTHSSSIRPTRSNICKQDCNRTQRSRCICSMGGSRHGAWHNCSTIRPASGLMYSSSPPRVSMSTCRTPSWPP